MQLYPAEPTGNLARHLKTLAALVSGIIGSKKVHLPAIASKVPDGRKRESRAKRFARFLQNPKVTPEAFFVPHARALMQSLPPGPLVLVMDGSQMGRGCMALMRVHGAHGERSLPEQSAAPMLARGASQEQAKSKPRASQEQAKKGHFTQERHQELLAQARSLVPSGRTVIFLGDGEFDGCGLLTDVTAAGWLYVCRTAKNVLLVRMFSW